MEGRETSNQKMKYKVKNVETKCQHKDTDNSICSSAHTISQSTKGYQLFDQSSHKVIFSQSVNFNDLVCGVEKESPTNTSKENLQVVIHDSRAPEDITTREVEEKVEEKGDDNQENPIEQEERTEPTVRRSQRENKRPQYYGVWLNTATANYEPNKVNEALSCYEKGNWKEAMEAEFKSLNANQLLPLSIMR